MSRRNSLRVFASEIVRLCDIINIDDEIYCEVVWIHLQVMKMPPLRELHMLVCQIGEHADRLKYFLVMTVHHQLCSG